MLYTREDITVAKVKLIPHEAALKDVWNKSDPSRIISFQTVSLIKQHTAIPAVESINAGCIRKPGLQY